MSLLFVCSRVSNSPAAVREVTTALDCESRRPQKIEHNPLTVLRPYTRSELRVAGYTLHGLSVCAYLAHIGSSISTNFFQLIWQYGEQQYASQQWSIAAEWYLAAAHGAFRSMASVRNSKCFRKAAICFIESKNYKKALELIRNCQTNEASTHYVRLLVASYQGIDLYTVFTII
jgi:hypothetical protein